jgi:hypothetical protein
MKKSHLQMVLCAVLAPANSLANAALILTGSCRTPNKRRELAIEGRSDASSSLGAFFPTRNRVVVILTFVAALLISSIAGAGGSSSDLGPNGQHRRHFYIVGHNPNTIDEVRRHLAAGANALEPDVMHFSEDAIDPDGYYINSYAADSGLFMYHDDVLLTTRKPTTVEDYLAAVHDMVKRGDNIALITFDIKSPAANREDGQRLVSAVQDYLNYDDVLVNVIFSVGDYPDVGIFGGIKFQIGPIEFDESDKPGIADQLGDTELGGRAGMMIDGTNDPVRVYNSFLVILGWARNRTGTTLPYNIGYGNGSAGESGGFAPNVLPSMDQATWIRASQGLAFSIPYAFPIEGASRMQEYMNTGVDGLIPDFDLLATPTPGTLVQIALLRSLVDASDEVYLATRNDNPFEPNMEVYALRVDTLDDFGAGTDSDLTFTLTGCAGTSSVTYDASYKKRFEQGDRNYVTIPSKDLGRLASLKLSSDGTGNGPGWDPGRIQISSAMYGIPYSADVGVVFSDEVSEDSDRTKSLSALNVGNLSACNEPPVADAGGPYIGTEGKPILFDGSASYDDDGDSLEYRWLFGTHWTAWTTSSTASYTWPEGLSSVTVQLEIRDTFKATSSDVTIVTVNNADPVIGSVTGDTINESGTATVSGSFSDSGVQDSFTVTINWGDGTPTVNYAYPAGSTGFSQTRQYLDDNPTNTNSDIYTIGITVADDDGGSDTASTSVTVNNVAPVATIDSVVDQLTGLNVTYMQDGSTTVPGAIDVVLAGNTLEMVGSYTDIGSLDLHTLPKPPGAPAPSIDWNDGTVEDVVIVASGVNASGAYGTTAVASHSYATSLAPGFYAIALTVTDDDTGSDVPTATIQVVSADSMLDDMVIDLQDLLDAGGLSPKVKKALKRAQAKIGGNSGGGALEHLNQDRLVTTLGMMLKAITYLEDAEAGDATLDLAVIKAQLVLTGRSIVQGAIDDAKAVASDNDDLRKIDQAEVLREKGDTALGSQDYTGAFEAYIDAVRKVENIIN